MSLDLVANLNHKPNCQCSFCKAMRGETSGINNNNYRHGIYTKRHYCVNCSREVLLCL